MKEQFFSFYSKSKSELSELWRNGTFVFDTNILLNLYRFPELAREDFFRAIEPLSKEDRIWLPHHVCLEYQRKRLQVITDQYLAYRQVTKASEEVLHSLRAKFNKLQVEKRHSKIDVGLFLTEIGSATERFVKQMDRVKSDHQSPEQRDPIREKIDATFGKLVGGPPCSQKKLDEIYFEAERRNKLEIPPGFRDAGKSSEDEYMHGNLTYKREYGDFLIWSQIIEHAANAKFKHLVFVTDDGKEDWWLKLDCEGKKTIGPRPELIAEIACKSEVTLFHMYNSEQFLLHAAEHLETKLRKDSIDEVTRAKSFRNPWTFSREMNRVFIRAVTARYDPNNTTFLFYDEQRYGVYQQLLDKTVLFHTGGGKTISRSVPAQLRFLTTTQLGPVVSIVIFVLCLEQIGIEETKVRLKNSSFCVEDKATQSLSFVLGLVDGTNFLEAEEISFTRIETGEFEFRQSPRESNGSV